MPTLTTPGQSPTDFHAGDFIATQWTTTLDLAYPFELFAQPATFALMFDPALLAETEVTQARDAAFGVMERVVGAVASQRGLSADVTHKVALAVWACGHGAASMTPAGAEASLMEDVIQGLEHLFGRR